MVAYIGHQIFVFVRYDSTNVEPNIVGDDAQMGAFSTMTGDLNQSPQVEPGNSIQFFRTFLFNLPNKSSYLLVYKVWYLPLTAIRRAGGKAAALALSS
jgi:hypothetical protein